MESFIIQHMENFLKKLGIESPKKDKKTGKRFLFLI